MSTPPIPVRKKKQLKRPNGAGSVYKVKDKDVWAVQFNEINPVTGTSKRKTKKFRTRKDALAFLEEVNYQKRTGTYRVESKSRLTIREFLENHLERYVAKKAPETYRNYQGAVKRICDEVGGISAAQFTPRDVEDLISALELKFGENTVYNAFAVLRAAFNKAVKLGEFKANPCLSVDAPARKLNPTPHIPQEDFKKIYETATLNPYSYARVEIGMFIPIRPGEILGLNWDDVDWEKGTLLVERQLQWVKGEGLIFRPPKNKKSRIIPISDSTMEILKNHKIYQEMNKSKWIADNNLIFPNTVGKPLDSKGDLKWWKNLLKSAEVNHYQIYQMRKTAISNLENLGTPTSTLLKFTGHSSMSVVLNHYATSTDYADAAALAGLDSIRNRVINNPDTHPFNDDPKGQVPTC